MRRGILVTTLLVCATLSSDAHQNLKAFVTFLTLRPEPIGAYA
jgi:hypothetical protein